MSDTPNPPASGFRTLGFIDFVRTTRGGKLFDEIEAEFALVMQAVNTTQNSGKVTLTLEIKPEKRSSETAVIIDTIKTTVPKFSNMGTIVFPTPEGRVSYDHPAQSNIPGVRDATSTVVDQAVDRRFANASFGT